MLDYSTNNNHGNWISKFIVNGEHFMYPHFCFFLVINLNP